MQCTNNLKQMVLAMHNVHDVTQYFPSGHKTVNTGTSAGTYYSNCFIQILPYIEQQGLYQQYDDTQPNIAVKNQLVCQSFVKTYACPSELRPKRLLLPETQAPSGGAGTIQYMIGSYRGMSGESNANNNTWAG